MISGFLSSYGSTGYAGKFDDVLTVGAFPDWWSAQQFTVSIPSVLGGGTVPVMVRDFSGAFSGTLMIHATHDGVSINGDRGDTIGDCPK